MPRRELEPYGVENLLGSACPDHTCGQPSYRPDRWIPIDALEKDNQNLAEQKPEEEKYDHNATEARI